MESFSDLIILIVNNDIVINRINSVDFVPFGSM